jgi:hypothetical protein
LPTAFRFRMQGGGGRRATKHRVGLDAEHLAGLRLNAAKAKSFRTACRSQVDQRLTCCGSPVRMSAPDGSHSRVPLSVHPSSSPAPKEAEAVDSFPREAALCAGLASPARRDPDSVGHTSYHKTSTRRPKGGRGGCNDKNTRLVTLDRRAALCKGAVAFSILPTSLKTSPRVHSRYEHRSLRPCELR